MQNENEHETRTDRVGAVEIRRLVGIPEKTRTVLRLLESTVGTLALTDLAPPELSKIGFVPLFADGPGYLELPGAVGAIMRFGMHVKIIPPAAVAAEVEKECEKVRVKTHAAPGAKLRRALRDQVVERMCANAFHVTRTGYLLFDAENRLLIGSGAPSSTLQHALEFLCRNLNDAGIRHLDGANGIHAFFAHVTGRLMQNAEEGVCVQAPNIRIRVGLADKARFVSRETGEALVVSGYAVTESVPARAALKRHFEGTMSRLVATMDEDVGAAGKTGVPPPLLFMSLSDNGKIAGFEIESAIEEDSEPDDAGEELRSLHELTRTFMGRMTAFRMAATVIDGLFAENTQERTDG